MALALTTTVEDRRTDERHRPHETPWLDAALMRPGQEVMVINLSSRGALLESSRRMRPGSRAELQLAGAGSRRVIRARILRCIVSDLNPIRYRGAVVFDERLVIDRECTG